MVKITRLNGGSAQTAPVALDALVLPNDLILVPQAQKIYLDGEVRRPGDYMYKKGLTVHKAITMAGGFTEPLRVESPSRKVPSRVASCCTPAFAFDYLLRGSLFSPLAVQTDRSANVSLTFKRP
jgi:hypothetical protein